MTPKRKKQSKFVLPEVVYAKGREVNGFLSTYFDPYGEDPLCELPVVMLRASDYRRLLRKLALARKAKRTT